MEWYMTEVIFLIFSVMQDGENKGDDDSSLKS